MRKFRRTCRKLLYATWEVVTSTAFSLCVILLCGGLFLVLNRIDQRQNRQHAAQIRQLQQEIQPYVREINQIRTDLQEREYAVSHPVSTSGMLFGFVPTSAADLVQIDALATAYDITPVIILDCSYPEKVLTAIVQKAVAQDYEVVLAGLQFDNTILQRADTMKALLEQLGSTSNPAFLLRRTVDTQANRNLLQEHGYTDLILYEDSLQSSTLDNGDPYLCYGFFRSPTYYADYISEIVSARTMLLASFDFAAIQDGTLQLTDIENFLTLANQRQAAAELRYLDLSSAFQAVADQNTTQQDRQNAYEVYKAKQEQRIQQLDEKIYAAYSREDEAS